MVDEPVDHGGAGDGIAEDLAWFNVRARQVEDHAGRARSRYAGAKTVLGYEESCPR